MTGLVIARLEIVHRQRVDIGWRQQLVELSTLGESMAHEALVARVLQQAANQVRHPRDELTDRRVHAQTQTAAPDCGLHRLRHAVEHLDLEASVGDPLLPRVGDRIGKRAQVVGAERSAHVAVVIMQQPDASFEVRVGLGLVLVHGDGPSGRSGVHCLGVPVRALDQADRDRCSSSRGERDEVRQIVAAVLRIRLDDDAGLEVDMFRLGEELAEQLQGQVLRVVVLHVEVHERTVRGRRDGAAGESEPWLARARRDA